MAGLKSIVDFVVRFAILGLAVAFLVVVWRPELLGQRRVAAQAPVTQATPAGLSSSYATAVARSAPAVVNIYSERVSYQPLPPSQLDRLFGEYGQAYRRRVERSLGSGVIIDPQGHIVTNNHVVEGASTIYVQLSDNRDAQAQVVGTDPDTDLAVLKIDLDNVPTMPLGRSDTLRVGDVVLAIGNPVGIGQTVTHGIVSAKGRGQLRLATFEDFIQTDAAINVGNSGGALVNADGELVGINTAVFSRTAGIEGISFAIPVNLVRGVMTEIFRNGRVVRGWLGVLPDDLNTQEARALGLPPEGGILVRNLYLDSPAYRAGLRPGDVITQLDGVPVPNAQEALARIASLAPGTAVHVTGLRGRQKLELTAKTIERPAVR
jgi:serine protease DegS